MTLHQTLIRLTRDFGSIHPATKNMTMSDALAVMLECEMCYRNHGHTENPYRPKTDLQEGDPEHEVWAAHALTIFDRIKAQCSPIEGEFDVLPPAPVPEFEQRFIRWEGEDQYV